MSQIPVYMQVQLDCEPVHCKMPGFDANAGKGADSVPRGLNRNVAISQNSCENSSFAYCDALKIAIIFG